MGALSDHVSLTITEDNVGIQEPGFGVPLILSHSATWVERTRTYSDISGVGNDFPTNSPEYLEASAMFDQTPSPALIKIGRAAALPTQEYQIGAISVVNTDAYSINVVAPTVTGSSPSTPTVATYTSDGSATTQKIHNGLVTALNAVTGANYVATFAPLTFTTKTFTYTGSLNELTCAAHGLNTGDGPFELTNVGGALPTGLATLTDYFVVRVDANTFQLATSLANALAGTVVTVTAAGSGTDSINSDTTLSPILPFLVTGSAPANWFSLEVQNVSLLSNGQIHADPGITNDLNAIWNADSGWYTLSTHFNSQAYVAAAAAWTESTASTMYILDVPETAAIDSAYTPGMTSDTGAQQATLGRARTAVGYHPSPANFESAAWLGRMSPIDPGQDDWKWKQLDGVDPVALTETQRQNLVARSMNSYQTVAKDITWEGTVADGDFIDNTRGLDWIEFDMTTGVFTALINAGKTPYDDGGIAIVESEVESSLKRAIDAGILTNSPAPVVTAPTAASATTANKAARTLVGVKFSATFAGAIHKVKLTGVVSV